MEWIVEYTQSALLDLKALDNTQQKQVLKAIQKVSVNPLPNTEGGYGKPLGNHLSSHLSGLLKIKLLKLGIRIVYRIQRYENRMLIIIISIRDNDTVYKMAEKRIQQKRSSDKIEN